MKPLKPATEEEIRLSRAGKAFKTELSWEEHERAAWVMSQGLHGWVDRDSSLYSGGFRCSVKDTPAPLWTWTVKLKVPGVGSFRARGRIQAESRERGKAAGKLACLHALRCLLAGLQSTPNRNLS